MRVIAGEFRSRRLKSPPGLDTRPTPDRLRESLFSILAPQVEGVTFVDAYAGCGAVGIEALSRGAARAIFIERNRGALRVLHENLRSLGIEDRAGVIHGNVSTYLESVQADIYFLDPPYDRPQEYDACLNSLASGLVIVQHASRHALLDEYRHLQRFRTLRQGDNSLSFYAPPTSQ